MSESYQYRLLSSRVAQDRFGGDASESLMLVPAGTPQPIVDRLSRESMRILQSEEIRRRFAEVGAEPVGGTPQQFAAFMAAETIKWAKVIKASGARVD